MARRTWFYSESEYLAEQGLPTTGQDEFGLGALGLPQHVMTERGARVASRLHRCAYAVHGSWNAKLLGLCATTYAAQASCPRPGDGVSPRPCPLYGNGCYGEHGKAGMSVRELNENAACLTHEQIASEEAGEIRGLVTAPCPQPLRLHTVGDCATAAAAELVGAAASYYTRRTGAPSWTYTHAWNVPRDAWGRVSVLFSCHTLEEVAEALRRCYAPSLLVQEYPHGARPYALARGLTGVPCPAIALHDRGVVCPTCRYCWDDGKLRRSRQVILFAPHGAGKAHARRSACSGACQR